VLAPRAFTVKYSDWHHKASMKFARYLSIKYAGRFSKIRDKYIVSNSTLSVSLCFLSNYFWKYLFRWKPVFNNTLGTQCDEGLRVFWSCHSIQWFFTDTSKCQKGLTEKSSVIWQDLNGFLKYHETNIISCINEEIK
jgi:hypothetical protein